MSDNLKELQARIKTLEAELAKYQAAEQATQARLERFDELDYVGYNQGIPKNDFTVFNEIHTEDVKVYMSGVLDPVTTTIQAHDEAMLPFFYMFPDHKFTSHPIAFGVGDWTCVVGVAEGTFSGEMITPDGTHIPGNGKPFRVMMATVAKWEGDRISEEYLFAPLDTIMKQIGMM